MRPDWQSVDRLLVACCFEQSVATLKPALQVLKRSLPQANITYLTSQTERYRFSTVVESSIFSESEPLLFVSDVPATNQPLQFTSIELVEQLSKQAFDVIIIFTLPLQTCYFIAYLAYLANIPIRLGQSLEFGGGVLSDCVKPPIDIVSPVDYHLHLLEATGFSIDAADYTPELILHS